MTTSEGMENIFHSKSLLIRTQKTLIVKYSGIFILPKTLRKGNLSAVTFNTSWFSLQKLSGKAHQDFTVK